jgi:pilus assembly protein CpaE
LDELNPALMRCLPGAAISDIRYYPSARGLEDEFANQTPELCFLDVVSDRERALALIPSIATVSPPTVVIVLLAGNEPELILKSLRLGASEFLLQPFNAEQLESALSKRFHREPSDGSPRRRNGRILCVMPAKGACGASTVACNIAVHWKRTGIERVLLADMDPLTGTQSFLLKLKSSYNFVDVLQHAERLDSDLWKAMVVQSKGLDVLLAPDQILEGLNELRNAAPVVEYARRNYDAVVMDAGGPYGDWNVSLARSCDDLLLVTTNELPALQGAQRALAYLEACQVGREKLRVVLNRFNPDIGLNKDLVGSALHAEVLQVIPGDYETVQKAMIEGKAIPPGCAIGKNIAALAEQLAPRRREVAKKAATRGGLLSLFTR